MAVLARVRRVVLPRLVREAEDRGWWSADLSSRSGSAAAAGRHPDHRSHRCRGPRLGRDRPAARSRRSTRSTATRSSPRGCGPGRGSWGPWPGRRWSGRPSPMPAGELLALGVAPSFRRQGLGAALLRSLVDGRPAGTGMRALVGVAERDWVEPLDVEVRRDVARRLLVGAGFELRAVSPDVSRDDPWAISARSRRADADEVAAGDQCQRTKSSSTGADTRLRRLSPPIHHSGRWIASLRSSGRRFDAKAFTAGVTPGRRDRA